MITGSAPGCCSRPASSSRVAGQGARRLGVGEPVAPELHAADYVARVADVRANGVPAQRLVLEVTEHAVATDMEELVRRLAALRATGVRIALDDFGAGYSSLGQLRQLPVDILKIDHELVGRCRRWSTWWSGWGTGSACRCWPRGSARLRKRSSRRPAAVRAGVAVRLGSAGRAPRGAAASRSAIATTVPAQNVGSVDSGVRWGKVAACASRPEYLSERTLP